MVTSLVWMPVLPCGSLEVARIWLEHRDADGPVTHSDQLLADAKSELTRQKFSVLLKQMAGVGGHLFQ